MNIVELLDLAKAKIDAVSDRRFCAHLNIDGRQLIDYRRGYSHPSDETMLRICQAACVSRERGLLMLNVWRSTGEARTTYSRLLQKLDTEAAPALPAKRKSRTREEQINT